MSTTLVYLSFYYFKQNLLNFPGSIPRPPSGASAFCGRMSVTPTREHAAHQQSLDLTLVCGVGSILRNCET